jgi:2-C-methyl-D-erythritol 4-phosphate cytidylyltransferase
MKLPRRQNRIRGAHRTAIVLAAGSGTRLGAGSNKVWLPLGGRELATWSFRWLIESQLFDRYVVVVHPAEREDARDILLKHVPVPVDIVDGGKSRHESETRALEYLSPTIESGECKTVLIHDGARPLAAPSLVRTIVEQAEIHGGALPYLETAQITGQHSGRTLVRVQTPQVFAAMPLLDAYRQAAVEGFEGSDTAMCLEKYRPEIAVKAVRGSAQNLKVTYPQDLIMAEHILAAQSFRLT